MEKRLLVGLSNLGQDHPSRSFRAVQVKDFCDNIKRIRGVGDPSKRYTKGVIDCKLHIT